MSTATGSGGGSGSGFASITAAPSTSAAPTSCTGVSDSLNASHASVTALTTPAARSTGTSTRP